MKLEKSRLAKLLLCTLLICTFFPTSFAFALPSDIVAWLTTFDKSQLLSSFAKNNFSFHSCENTNPSRELVTIDRSRKFQAVTGFGAALTESAAIALKTLPLHLQKEIIQTLFDSHSTAQLNVLRIPIGATDFSIGNYSCADAPKKSAAFTVEELFNLQKCTQQLLPILKEIKKANPNLILIASPWSPPAWMKDSQSLIGGKLLPEHYQNYAIYLSLFVEKMAAEGLPVTYLSVLNEPLISDSAPVAYPWAHMSANDQAQFIGNYLGPELKKRNLLSKVKILGFDHNWSEWRFPDAILSDPDAQQYVTGTAFHCYGGNFSDARKLKVNFPDKEIHLTECTSGQWSPGFGDSFTWGVYNLIFGHFYSGTQSLVYWNLLLDSTGGPTNNGCEHCRGVLNLNADGTNFDFSPEYFILAHASAVLNRGDRIIATSSSTSIHQIAAEKENSNLAWIAMNPFNRPQPVTIQFDNQCLSLDLPPESVISLKITP